MVVVVVGVVVVVVITVVVVILVVEGVSDGGCSVHVQNSFNNSNRLFIHNLPSRKGGPAAANVSS